MPPCLPTHALTRENTATPPLQSPVPDLRNPLVLLRLTDSNTATVLSRAKWATKLGTSKSTVQNAENGVYITPPIPYRKLLRAFHYAAYQDFRTTKRRENFTPEDFPETCAKLTDLLEHLGLSPFQFADRICVQPAEVFQLINNPSRRNKIPFNLLQAFQDIDVSVDFIRRFHV